VTLPNVVAPCIADRLLYRMQKNQVLRGRQNRASAQVLCLLLTGIVMMPLFLHPFFGPWRRFGHAVEREAVPEAAKPLDQIRRIVATNLVLGLLTVIVGASGRFW
jgi:uncharacterized membrane protein